MIEGELYSSNLEEFYQTRAQYFMEYYTVPDEKYFSYTVSEFEKVNQIPSSSTIHLWFEDDLFCQTNLWFILYLLAENSTDSTVYLVRPLSHSPYSFGHLTNEELKLAFEQKIPIENLTYWSALWNAYASNNTNELLQWQDNLKDSHPYISGAIQAHFDRLPQGNSPGRPIQTLLTLINELKTTEFGPLFREFQKREGRYGYGDMQVKRLLDIAIEQHL